MPRSNEPTISPPEWMPPDTLAEADAVRTRPRPRTANEPAKLRTCAAHCTLTPAELEAMDEARGDRTRSDWIRGLILAALANHNTTGAPTVAA
ncbi:MAG: hypothetical protein V3T70_03245 [Phycisphaerae bacterium]